MFRILLWVTISVMLTACQILKDNKPEGPIAKPKIQDKEENSVLELHYDETQQKLVLQETNDIDGENIVNIPENSLENAKDTRVLNNDNVIVKYEGEKNKEKVAADLVEPIEPIRETIVAIQPSILQVPLSETIIIVETPKMKFPGIDTVNNIDLSDEKIAKAEELEETNLANEKMPKIEEIESFNLENPEILEVVKDNGSGIDIVFDKEGSEQKEIQPKYNLGSGANVVFEKKEVNPINLSEEVATKLPMDVKSLANRKQPILENQLKKQYKKEKESQKNTFVKNRSTKEISRDIFDKFSREINKDISRLENIKKSYQNIDKSTAYIKNDNNKDNAALTLLEGAYYANQTADITDISLESIKKVVTKVKQNKKGVKNNFLDELLELQSQHLKPIKKSTKKQHNLLTLSLSNVQKVIEEQENALKDDTKMWQSIDKKSNKLVQEKIKNNQLLKRKLARLKKQLNGTGTFKMSKTQLRHIIEELNQLDMQLNRPNKPLNKKVNQSDIDKLLQELKKAKY